MGYESFDGGRDPGRYLSETVQHSARNLVVGAFGVGKTTLIGSVSEIPPLRTEETMTSASVGVDDLAALDAKASTTAAMDFGRITATSRLVLYLFCDARVRASAIRPLISLVRHALAAQKARS